MRFIFLGVFSLLSLLLSAATASAQYQRPIYVGLVTITSANA